MTAAISPSTPSTPSPVPHPVAGRLLGKINRRLIPFLCLLFIVNYLDRTNVAMAKLRMLADVHFDERAYGLGTGLFFIGYFIFEVPSNLILHRVGARRWIARIMISWGIISAAMVFVRGAWSFAGLRFALGVAEAGFFPGIILYLTYWIPSQRRAGVLATFLTATAVSGLIGNPLGGLLMKLGGRAGLFGWQWLFLIEGIPPVLLGLAILIWPILPDSPAQAGWVDAEERQWIQDELHRDAAHPNIRHATDFLTAAKDGRLWLLAAVNFCLVMGLYGFIYWLPTMLQSMTHVSDAKVGLLSAIPYLLATIGMVVIGKLADRWRRRTMITACATIGAAGLGLSIAFVDAANHPVLGISALSIAAIGIFGTLGPFWTIPTRYLRDTAAAGGIAIVNCVSALAGFVAPTIMGWAKASRGSLGVGLSVVAISLLLGAQLVRKIPASVDGVEVTV